MTPTTATQACGTPAPAVRPASPAVLSMELVSVSSN
jgi:hypothetical protein